jgi:tetratricopeptide (TPR) repeat protein
MRFDIRQSWARALVALLLTAAFAVATTGCEKTPKDSLRTAKGAVINEKPDKAEEHLKKVLAADPDNFEAKRLMARVHQLRENYAEAEELIQGLWAAQGFDDDSKKLSTEQKSQKKFLEDDLTGLYSSWSQSIDQKENPEKFEEVAKKGLEIDPKKPRLNSLLVEFYENRAKKLVEEGKKLEAAAVYESILELRTLPQKRSNAKERAGNLRFEFNKDQMLTYFNDKAKAKFVKEERYDEENKAILIALEESLTSDMETKVEAAIKESRGQEIDLDPRDDKHAAIICDVAMREELQPALEAVIVEATGLPKDSDFSSMQVPPRVAKGVKIAATRRECALQAVLPLDDVLKMGFEVKEQTREAAEKKEAKADKKADPAADGAPKAEADQAGDK